MKNRAAATKVAASMMAELFPGSGNDTLIQADLEKLSDEEFDQLIQRLRQRKPTIAAVLPNGIGQVVTTEHLKKIAKRWGVNYWQYIEMQDPDTGKVFTTPLRYMVIREVTPRLQQMIEDKQSIPDDNTHVDDLTGQVTGPSKGARISFQELNNLVSRGMTTLPLELISVRGGDEEANRKLESDIMLTGSGTVESAKENGSGVTSTKNFATLLRTAHLDTTLDK